MKLLFVISHFYGSAKANHGSTRSPAEDRANALTQNLLALWQLFGPEQGEIDIQHRRIERANQQTLKNLDVIICTTGENHLVKDLNVEPGMFTQCPVTIEPMLLGYACHAVLRENIGKYDYYCWLEDDIIMQDPLFFEKIQAFNRATDPMAVLQPNRYEIKETGKYRKAYVDGDIRKSATEKYHNIDEQPVIELGILGRQVGFKRRLNPHAGCFFITAEQMQHWSEQPYFLDMDTSFVSPLESSANIGVIRTFRQYKPDRPYANFLEVRHLDNRFISLIR